jgi:hypothetical protein
VNAAGLPFEHGYSLLKRVGDRVTTKEEMKFHSDRAEAELDLGLHSRSVEAARAHYDLSALHFEKMRELSRKKR